MTYPAFQLSSYKKTDCFATARNDKNQVIASGSAAIFAQQQHKNQK